MWLTSLCLAGLFVPFQDSVAPSATESVALEDTNSASALVDEAFRASKSIAPEDPGAANSLQAVAEALGLVGRSSEARLVLGQAEAQLRRDRTPDRLAYLAPAYFRVHSTSEILRWLSRQEDRELQARMARQVVERHVLRGERSELPDALGILVSQNYPGWNPGGDAWLSIGYRALGQLDSARSYERRVLQETVYEGMERDFAQALDALTKDRLRAGDPKDAERMLLEFTKSEALPAGYTVFKFELVQSYVEQESFDSAREVMASLANSMYAAWGHAELGAALLAAEDPEQAEVAFEQAVRLAREQGVMTRSLIAEVLSGSNREELAGELLHEALERVREDTGRSQAMNARLVAQAAEVAGHREIFSQAEAFLDEENRRVWIERAGFRYVEDENLEAWQALLDPVQDPDALYRALRFASAWPGAQPRSSEFNRALADDLARRARTLEAPSRRAEILARLVANELVTEG